MNKEAQAWLGVIAVVVIIVGALVLTNPAIMEQLFDGKAARAIQAIPGDGTGTPTPPPGGGTPGTSGGGSCSTADNDHDGQSPCQGDCNDGNPTIFRGAIEYCGNNVDEDCSGVADACVVNMTVQTTQSSYFYTNEVELK